MALASTVCSGFLLTAAGDTGQTEQTAAHQPDRGRYRYGCDFGQHLIVAIGRAGTHQGDEGEVAKWRIIIGAEGPVEGQGVAGIGGDV